MSHIFFGSFSCLIIADFSVTAWKTLHGVVAGCGVVEAGVGGEVDQSKSMAGSRVINRGKFVV